MNLQELEKFEALLFDLDGTLVDTMDLHNQAWIETIESFGHEMTVEILRQYAGVPNFQTVEIFNQKFSWKLDPQDVTNKKEARFLKNIPQIKTINPVFNIAKEFYQKKPMAIVTGGSKELVHSILNVIKAENMFPVKVCAEDTQKHKPNPEPFLLAAKKLGIDPTKCLVFEDGQAGMQGAKTAGMKVIQVMPDFKLVEVN